MSSPRPELRVDWCSYQAAKYAVEKWHYSKTMPVSKRVTIGAWEDGIFIGSIVFSWGANPNLSKPYGLNMTECVELVRVALAPHISPTSKIVSQAVKMLERQSPGVRLVVSYADTREAHVGIIYQAMNWTYTGDTSVKFDYELNGRVLQRRSYTGRNFNGTRRRVPLGANKIQSPSKHRYLYPLDRAMRRQIAPLAQPYPKRESCGPSVEGDTSGVQPEHA
jgi:hypothetical protein